MAAATARERSELRSALSSYRRAFLSVCLLSAILNVLLLGGSFYLMLIYDSVLPSHSLPTLYGLLVMIVLVYAFQGLFDNLRARILSDIAMSFTRKLSGRVQQAMGDAARAGQGGPGDGLGNLRDLEQIRSFLAGAGPAAFIDLPWILFFLGFLAILHIWLGVTALIGALILMALTWWTNRQTREPTAQLGQIAAYRNNIAETHLRHGELIHVLGMGPRLAQRWEAVDDLFLSAQHQVSLSVQTLGGVSRIFRLFLQSLILTVGAILVINGEASAGVIFASSVLSGRALAPVDQAIANWRGFTGARMGWTRLAALLDRFPAPMPPMTSLPAPTSRLQVEQVYVAPPGTNTVVVHGANFTLQAGMALGIIGPSAAGKTTLGKAIIGAWPAVRGTIRLDGAAIDQWEPHVLGRSLGYLPQSVELLDGTIADNIARFEAVWSSEDVIAAARAANVHDMIVALPNGYETQVGTDGGNLSAGQRQRLGLARALYRDPFLVVLDEPNSNLDADGEQALTAAIAGVRARNGICIVIAHRPSALANVSHVLVMREGRMESFGPKDEVLERVLGKPRIIRSQPDHATSET